MLTTDNGSNGIWDKLRDREFRSHFSAAQFKRFVPFQITALRKARGWSQEKLAEESGLTQGVISRAEDQNNGNLAVNTILKIANGFDLVFIGKFVSYGEFVEWFDQATDEIKVPTFSEQDAGNPSQLNSWFKIDKNTEGVPCDAMAGKKDKIIEIDLNRNRGEQGERQQESPSMCAAGGQ
jgi:transcriptional regulator with XRE-family HTH domain